MKNIYASEEFVHELIDGIETLAPAILHYEFTEEDILDGYFITGDEAYYGKQTSSQIWRCTNYISLAPFIKGEAITVRCTLYGNGAIGFYNADKQTLLAISGKTATSYGYVANINNQTISIVPPENAEYVRLCEMISTGENPEDFELSGPALIPISHAIDTKLDKNFGIDNKDKILVVGSDGIVVPNDISLNSETDTTLKIENKPADAKAVGNALSNKANSYHTHAQDTITGVREACLSWGGWNISGAITPIDAACSSFHNANRFAYGKPAGITIEYSNDGGTTWLDYEATDDEKIGLVTGFTNVNLWVGRKKDQTNVTVDDQLRITLDATKMGLYSTVRKLLINLSTNGAGGTYVEIEKSLKGSEDTFTKLHKYNVAGWSGWNSCPASYGAFGGGATQTSNTAIIRLTFGMTSLSSTSNNAYNIRNIIAIGDNSWSWPSELARTGHMYTHDRWQNVTFPAAVTAKSQFIGNLNGTASKATADASGNNIVNTYETKADANAKMSKVMKLPENGSTGTLGQFAVSDGEGGIMWFSVLDGEEAEF